MQDYENAAILPVGTECVTKPGSTENLLQIAVKHPTEGWIAVEIDRQNAAKLALELQAFADYRSTADEDA